LDFKKDILPRLSSGDNSLWREFSHAISQNHADDASKTLALFRNLKMRQPAHTHVHGYDYVLAVPVFVDNVGTPYVDRQNKLGIDVDAHYSGMLDSLCRAYKARWHA